eukprot:2547476-Pleurochrysis_carterae.AAC.3
MWPRRRFRPRRRFHPRRRFRKSWRGRHHAERTPSRVVAFAPDTRPFRRNFCACQGTTEKGPH